MGSTLTFFRSAGVVWLFLTAVIVLKVWLAPELLFATQFSDPAVSNTIVTFVLGSAVVLFFLLPEMDLLAVALLGAVWFIHRFASTPSAVSHRNDRDGT